MGKEDIVVQVGIELMKILLNSAFALMKTHNVPAEEIDAAFRKAKAEFDANPPDWQR